MKARDDEVQRVAESIADHAPVDWEAARGASGRAGGVLSRLRVIESIAAVHRSPHGAERSGPSMDSPDVSDMPTVQAGRQVLFRWGHLDVIEKIGEGGFGEVFKAYDTKLEREVALKLRRGDRGDPFGSKRFLDEARRLARVRHANVLTVYGADEHDGRVGLWADHLDGRTLQERLKREGTLGEAEAANVGIQICQALAAVHAAGLVHRDVKSSNVIREEGGRHVLLDFSSVTEMTPGASGNDPVSGTPLYMAPELFEGKDAGPASDIYSLGVVLYYLASGRYPAEGKKLSDLREKHRKREYTPLRDHRPGLNLSFLRVVERAMSPDPARRYQTAGEMEKDLRASLGAPEAEPAEPWPRPKRIALAATLAAAAALILLLALALWPGGLQVEASLYRVRQGAEERLLPGGRVAPGDQLFLEIEGSRRMHVYVLNEDATGGATVLFPLDKLDTGNPLEAEIAHHLPGTIGGAERYWQVTSAGGEESFLVIASMSPVADIEREIAGLPQAMEGMPVQVGTRTVEKLRGVTGLSAGTAPEGDASQDGLSTVKNQAGRAAGEGGIWVWEIRLENPTM